MPAAGGTNRVDHHHTSLVWSHRRPPHTAGRRGHSTPWTALTSLVAQLSLAVPA